jgi:CheY-like chemotaxis protein
MNLYTNAGHVMQENGGTLEVSLTDVELDFEYTAKHPGLKPGTYLKLAVSDTGHGIPPDVQDQIFDPFFTTKKEGEGTGMGLSVVHGIVKSHGGTITVYSEPQKGSIFNVFLPVIENEIEPETIIEKPVPSGTERILFIDDEQTLADLGKQMLESLGYDVAVRTSSIEALELFKNKPDGCDLVITDLTMPQMTGDELAQKLMAIRPDIPVILCTGFSARMDEKKARAMGIREFVYKPLLRRDMAEIIRKVLDGNNTLGDSSIKEPLQLGCRLKKPRYAGHGI